jgi:hypothetical protein
VSIIEIGFIYNKRIKYFIHVSIIELGFIFFFFLSQMLFYRPRCLCSDNQLDIGMKWYGKECLTRGRESEKQRILFRYLIFMFHPWFSNLSFSYKIRSLAIVIFIIGLPYDLNLLLHLMWRKRKKWSVSLIWMGDKAISSAISTERIIVF